MEMERDIWEDFVIPPLRFQQAGNSLEVSIEET
jgi:hypothetical protein